MKDDMYIKIEKYLEDKGYAYNVENFEMSCINHYKYIGKNEKTKYYNFQIGVIEFQNKITTVAIDLEDHREYEVESYEQMVDIIDEFEKRNMSKLKQLLIGEI
jgi:protein-tyrosine phosphatase